jgi:hypothetical protein
MIPEDNNQHHDTPKRFNVGYFCRETLELFHEGWHKSSLHMKEHRRLEEAKQTRKYIVELLEESLYDATSRGTTEQKLEALNYFQRKKESETLQDQRPYTWGEQLSSVALNAASLSAIAVMFSFSATWSCGQNQSQFCQDIRATTGGVVQYFSSPKL